MVVSPIVPSYTTATPYLSVADFQAAPTSLDLSNLVPGGSTAAQTQAIATAIRQASSVVDGLCNGQLAATVDLDRGRYRIAADGCVRIPLRFEPLLAVTAISFGLTPSALTALTDTSNVAVMNKTVEIPLLSQAAGFLGAGVSAIGVGARPIVDVTYVNGFVCTTLSADVAAAATAITPTSVLGIYAGTGLMLYDSDKTEAVMVGPSYVAGAASVPLVAPLGYGHVRGTSLSNLPDRVRQATVLLTTAILQVRGEDAIILETLETPQRMSGAYGALGPEVQMARDMLRGLARVW